MAGCAGRFGTRKQGKLLTGIAVVAAVFLLSENCEAFLPIYGGATYTATGGYTYQTGPGGFYPHPLELLTTSQNDIGPTLVVNDDGVAVGKAGKYDSVGNSLGMRSVRYNAADAPFEMGNLSLAPPGFNGAAPTAINSSGVVVGEAFSYTNQPGFPDAHNIVDVRAVRWDATGTTATLLNGFGVNEDGHTYVVPYAVNSTGAAVGASSIYDTDHSYMGSIAVRWNAGSSTPTALAGASFGSAAFANNDEGTAVGYSHVTNNQNGFGGDRAIRWASGGTAATVLNSLGSDANGVNFGYAWDINSAGTTVGFSGKFDGSGQSRGYRAVRWNAGTASATELGIIGPDIPSDANTLNAAYAINTSGAAVGVATMHDADGNYRGLRPARWAAGSTAATELGILGLFSGQTDGRANDINDFGVAVGRVVNYNNSFNNGYVAVAWSANNVAVNLNDLIDPASGWNLQEATAISNTGWVTGWGFFSPTAGTNDQYVRQFLLRLPLLGDFNGDYLLTAADIPAMLAALTDLPSYESQRNLTDATLLVVGDIDGSGAITNADIQPLLDAIAATGGGSIAAVPEPDSMALLAMGGLVCTRLRRRRRIDRTLPAGA